MMSRTDVQRPFKHEYRKYASAYESVTVGDVLTRNAISALEPDWHEAEKHFRSRSKARRQLRKELNRKERYQIHEAIQRGTVDDLPLRTARRSQVLWNMD